MLRGWGTAFVFIYWALNYTQSTAHTHTYTHTHTNTPRISNSVLKFSNSVTHALAWVSENAEGEVKKYAVII